jgi:KAP family P-loop domain
MPDGGWVLAASGLAVGGLVLLAAVRTRISRISSRRAAHDLSVKENCLPRSGPFQILSDVATGAEQYDYLRFARYADALAFIIDQRDTSTPLIMAISAPWGAGKTTLANLVEEQLRENVAWNERHIICRFNAWRHDNANNLGAAFAADVANHANGCRHWWHQVFDPLPSPMLKPEGRWWRRIWVVAAAAIVAMSIVIIFHMAGVAPALITPTHKEWEKAAQKVPGFSAVFITAFVFTFLFSKVHSGMRSIARFIDDPGAEAARGSVDQVRDELGHLIRGATRGQRRFVIFVDDLERCRPPRAVEVCEIASQLLNHPGVVVVFVADMDTIATSAAIKYRELEVPNSQEADPGAYEQYGREYLQKIVQVEFELPAPAPIQLKEMLLANRKQADSKSPSTKRKTGVNGDKPASGSRDSQSGRDEPDLARSFLFFNPYLVFPILFAFVFLGSQNYLLYVREFYIFGILISVPFVAVALQVRFTLRAEDQRRKRAEEKRKRIDKKIEALSWDMTIDAAVDEIFNDQDDKDDDTEEANLYRRGSGAAQDKVSRSYIRRRIFKKWLELLQERDIAPVIDSLVYRFLPQRPRAAKRLLNQVRLMMVIALSRDLLRVPEGQNGRQRWSKKSEMKQARWLGKWLVLLERWPAVAEFMENHRDQITNLEKSRSLELTLRLNGVHGVDDIKKLQQLLSLDPPLRDIDELILLGKSATSSLKGSPL